MSRQYKLKTSCPQCGCSAVSHLTKDEIKKRYGDIPNVEMECSECILKYETPMKDACPEWDNECKMEDEK
ncbi:putative heat shock protein Hsp33 [Desulfamplus magnetovallimortis]|uniref:Putative heat shock protein Hsp33 n=1 Tax=Desulfamplus magnetovallimortis TaxID=1246637 RepID=A0A1W1H832_9BACT|nr:hypothetical protein [Desulfamplus magnetovallimortis]SLM28632.1 putative heat shock protein Hsp33 [Desulfamplus magnetovallimortis]